MILGNVISSGLGQNPARQASLLGGVDISVPCTNVNKVCASGMKAIMYGTQEIQAGHAEVILVGGFESMSNAPHLIKKSRNGFKFGEFTAEDAILTDGLVDAFTRLKMGNCAEKTAKEMGITRKEQDRYCVMSYERSLESKKMKRFESEIVPIEIKGKGFISHDEEPGRYQEGRVETARLAFPDSNKQGSVTTMNASKLNDGACVMILMSEEALARNSVKAMVEVVNFADAEVEPADFNKAPVAAILKALKKCNLEIKDIDFWEINEAFSVTVLVFVKTFGVGVDRININGGSVSLGHPLGMSGARIVQSLISVLKRNKGKLGCAAICNGGGGASAIIVRNVD